MTKILTISVAAYNAEKWLAKCLDSICIPEIMEDIEVFIVNDGSTDRTGDIGKAYQSRYPDTIRLIEKENSGHGSTINIGIQKASGRYFKLVDADDWVERNGIIDLVKKLTVLDVDVVISPFFYVNEESVSKTLETALVKKSLMNHVTNVESIDSTFYDCLHMHALTFKTELLQENFIPIDEKCFFVDLEYVVFYFSRVKSVYFSEVPVYDYLVGTSYQSVDVTNKVRRRKQHLRMVRRLMDFYDAEGQSALLPLAAVNTVKGAIISEYGVLFHIPDREQSLREVRDWEAELKSRFPKLYREAICFGIKTRKETAMAVEIMRLTRFHGFKIIHKVFNR